MAVIEKFLGQRVTLPDNLRYFVKQGLWVRLDGSAVTFGFSEPALALSGGGPAVGIEIGALKAFEEKGITFDIFSCACVGSWVGCLYNSLLPGSDRIKKVEDFFFDKIFIEDDIYEIFQLIEGLKFPVGKAIPIAAYHWEDGDSMADNNTSCFNFRVIEGTSKLSMHSLGKALDINPVQNPVIYPNGVAAPEGSKYRPQESGAVTADHPIVREFLRRGWHWGGNFDQPKDDHHFQKP